MPQRLAMFIVVGGGMLGGPEHRSFSRQDSTKVVVIPGHAAGVDGSVENGSRRS